MSASRVGRAVLGTALLLLLLAPVLAGAASNELTWVDNSIEGAPGGAETNFHIERKAEACPGPALWVELAVTGANVTRFIDATVQPGVTYCYRVAASNPAGKSAYSNTAQRTVPLAALAAPSGLTVGGGP